MAIDDTLPHTSQSVPSYRSHGSFADTVSEHDHPADDPGKALTPQLSRVPSKPAPSRKVTTGTSDPHFEIEWEDASEPANPQNWPLW